MASFSGARSNATELENEDSNSSKSISLDIIKENEESGYATSLLNGKDNDDDQARHYRASSDKSHDGNSRRGSSMPKNPEPTEAEKRRRASSNDASNQRLKHLETENGELKKQVSILKRRLLKDLSKSTYLTNTIFSKIPTSVQVNRRKSNVCVRERERGG